MAYAYIHWFRYLMLLSWRSSKITPFHTHIDEFLRGGKLDSQNASYSSDFIWAEASSEHGMLKGPYGFYILRKYSTQYFHSFCFMHCYSFWTTAILASSFGSYCVNDIPKVSTVFGLICFPSFDLNQPVDMPLHMLVGGQVLGIQSWGTAWLPLCSRSQGKSWCPGVKTANRKISSTTHPLNKSKIWLVLQLLSRMADLSKTAWGYPPQSPNPEKVECCTADL
jgi:hypothetical protein